MGIKEWTMNTTTVSDVARWAQWFANLSGASIPIRLRFSEGWIFGSGSPPFSNKGGIYIFADGDGVGCPATIDASLQKVLDVGKANDNIVGRIMKHRHLCKDRRIVVYTINVDDSLIGSFSPHLPTILEKFVFSCCVRHCGAIPEWNITFGNGKPNRLAKPQLSARTPSGADIARWAREFAEMSSAQIPAFLSFATQHQPSNFPQKNSIKITAKSLAERTQNLEESTDPIIRIGKPNNLVQHNDGSTEFQISFTSPLDSTFRFRCSFALEMFLKYSFVRCTGAPPLQNDTRIANSA